MKHINRIITVLIFVFLYIPMAVLIVASFNTGKDITQFEGFTLQQYVRLFQDRELLKLLGNSLLISILASGLSTVFGTFAAVGIHGLKPRMRKVVMNLTNIPMTNPDIVTGISLSLLFVFIGSKLLGQKDSLTFWTLLIAHMTFNLPYVILNVMPKLQQMNPALTDAAMDLGCTPLKAFFKVTLPEIMPGVIAGAIMAFTMSLDDFVISYFVTGMDFVTLPVKIYSEVKKPIQPKLYAMFTLLFLLILILMIAMNVIQVKGDKKKKSPVALSKARKVVYAAIAAVLVIALGVGAGFLLGNDIFCTQHGCMGHGTGDILLIHFAVKADGRIEIVRNAVRNAGGPPGPHFSHKKIILSKSSLSPRCRGDRNHSVFTCRQP